MLAHAKTDIGKVREINEDSFLCEPPLAMVADGMGGHVAGEIASKLAINTVRDHNALYAAKEKPDILLEKAISKANALIFRMARQKSECAGMGTTVTAVYVDGSKIHWGHVGDSRLYLFRGGELTQLTEDHSLVGELLRSGNISREEAFSHPQRNILTRAVGTEEQISVDIGTTEWFAGDKILLCTDGLTTMVRDEEIQRIIGSASGRGDAVTQLIDLANQTGGLDNITIILLQNEGF